MLSIITAVFNQLDMNKLFWEYLKRYTDNEFELIIIDNNSNDGSREFFQSLPKSIVKVIENKENYSYPHCQNQGIALAKFDTLVFLNNDILVSAHWDSRMLKMLGKDKRHILSFGSNDRIYDKPTTKKLEHKWKRIKYPLITLFGQRYFSLKLMSLICYGNWEKFTERIFTQYGYSLTTGFSGSAIAMTREGINLLGEWDLSQQGADFDLFYRTCHRSETTGDILPMATVNGIFIHHYRRLTLYSSKYAPFADAENLRSLDSKWNQENIDRWEKLRLEFLLN